LCYAAVEVLKMTDKTWTGTMPTIKKFGFKEAVFYPATALYSLASLHHIATLANSGNNRIITV